MTRSARAIIGGAPLAALVLVASAASGNQALASDCAGGFKDIYNPGDLVCATGDVDYKPAGKICNEAYIHVVPKGNPNPFAKLPGFTPKYVIGCSVGGAFFDEKIWLPPTKPGTWELVIDEFPFGGAFDPTRDARSGAFIVRDVPVVMSVDVAAIKDDAKKGLAAAQGIYQLTRLLTALDALSTAADWGAAFGIWGAAAAIGLAVYCDVTGADCPTSYDSAVITMGNKILLGMSDSLSRKYGALIADPPDSKFLEIVPPSLADAIALGAPWAPRAAAEPPRRQTAIAQLVAIQSASWGAIVSAVEKLQGAKIANSNLGMLLQAEKLAALVSLASEAGDRMITEITAFEAWLSGAGVLDKGVDPTAVKGALDSVAASGFSKTDEAKLRSFGLTDADLATVKAQMAKLTVPPSLSYKAVLDGLRASYAHLQPALTNLAKQAEAIRSDSASKTFRPQPVAKLTLPTSAKVGTAASLSASATSWDTAATFTFDWDADMDGAFDDGKGATLAFVPKAPGKTLVAVRATDAAGRIDVVWGTVDVTSVNEPPTITGWAPKDPAPFAKVGDKTSFHVDATDPDGDALTYAWNVDGKAAGAGADFSFAMADEDPHRVSVVVSDGNATSPDATLTFVVRAARWAPIIGPDGDAGTTDASTSDAAADAPAPDAGGVDAAGTDATTSPSDAASPAESSGCGCSTPGSHAPPSALAALAAIVVVALRRKRRAA
ncbi:MAG: hypothetical protein HYV09_37365 [Deltaproteobacteria bacterium]|nr:hypothetical protein [Deltaproteobacteria bacterium]